MGKYLITGRQGCGKTTVIKQLQQLGFTAYNTDDLPEATKLQNIESGEVIEWPKTAVDWTKYAWNWQKPEIERLLASSDTVFLGGVVSNQKDFYPLLDTVFILTVSEQSLRGRLQSHEHESHHLPGEIDRIINNHTAKQQQFIDDGAVPINGERSASEIADEILQQIKLS